MTFPNATDVRLGEKLVDRVYEADDLLWGRIPTGYKRCNYIEASGTQYIDLGFVPSDDYGFKIVAERERTSSDEIVIGVDNGTSSTTGKWCLNFYNSDDLVSWNTSITLTSASTGAKRIYSLNYRNSRLSCAYKDDGTLIKSTTTGSTLNKTYNNNALMFAAHWRSTSVSFYAKAKVYHCEITDGINTIHSYVPCLDADGVPCMYDSIAKETLYNAGTGTFSYELAS